ncbi:hypothetical protein [Zhihengliuella sp.]|uniref:hypothetical protein n=1 Tax=Zhihengliuella sp. TaxID=1954483 RepID=UPI00281236C3|nr:hypothetical protein [Zhihengliuella sp.]
MPVEQPMNEEPVHGDPLGDEALNQDIAPDRAIGEDVADADLDTDAIGTEPVDGDPVADESLEAGALEADSEGVTPVSTYDAAGEFTELDSEHPDERPIGDDPVIPDPVDGRDASPVEEGDQDLPSTLDAEDPLRDATDPIDDQTLPPPPLPDGERFTAETVDRQDNPYGEPDSATVTRDPDDLPDGTKEEPVTEGEGPNDEENRFDAG